MPVTKDSKGKVIAGGWYKANQVRLIFAAFAYVAHSEAKRPLMAHSAGLLSISRKPCSRYGRRRFRRVSAYRMAAASGVFCRLQPALQIVEARPGLGPADCNAPVGRLPAGFLLDGVERRDAFQRLGRDRRAPGGMDIEELPSHMRQAGDLADRPGAGELAEPGIAVGMHPAAEARQMRLRMFGPPVH